MFKFIKSIFSEKDQKIKELQEQNWGMLICILKIYIDDDQAVIEIIEASKAREAEQARIKQLSMVMRGHQAAAAVQALGLLGLGYIRSGLAGLAQGVF